MRTLRGDSAFVLHFDSKKTATITRSGKKEIN
jgi:hypothetical protein